jgi:restriction system protein
MRNPSPTVQVATKVVYAAFELLRENGGQMRVRDILAAVAKRVPLDDWAKERYESGYVRWQTFLQFYSGDCVKAGFLRKKSGTWFLTEEGEKAMALGAEKFLQASVDAYRKWDAERKSREPEPVEDPGVEPGPNPLPATMDQIQELANESLERHIAGKNAYEFQDLAAALLRGMSYFTPFVAPHGKDGGVDVVAYRDPLGTMAPRIKVQVKHRQNAASVDEIRQLMGLLQRDGDVGIFISTGGFTSDARSLAQGSHVHVELIDLTRFIELWQGNYPKLSDEDKVLMPLVPVYFLAETD